MSARHEPFKTRIVEILKDIKGAWIQCEYRKTEEDSYYEAYVYCLILKSIGELGNTTNIDTEVFLRSRYSPDRAPRTFIFKGGPGKISTKYLRNSPDYGHALCIINGFEYEAHLDTLCKGRSGGNNEIDIAVIRRPLNKRQAIFEKIPPVPLKKLVRGVIECKWYPDADLSNHLIRAFYGLYDEFKPPVARLVSGQNSEYFELYCTKRPKKIRFSPEIKPSKKKNVADFIAVMKDEFKNMKYQD